VFVKDNKGREIEGVLVKMEPDEQTRLQFEIWFPYTRQAMNLIREGAMLAVKNFASDQKEFHYSILEVVTVLPLHYAIEEIRGNPFPGFVVEAARSASHDWYAQEEEASEETTKIRVIAVPTNLELVNGEKVSIQVESNEPMLGEAVYIFDTPMTERIVNSGIHEKESTIEIGKLVRDEKVGIKARVEDLIRTHFGIFGYTGAGKSNLLSTIIRKLLTNPVTDKEKLKFVIFDLMGEYTGLLIDLLVEMEKAFVVCVEDETLPESVIDYLAGNKKILNKAVEDLTKTMLLPKGLRAKPELFKEPIRKLLSKGGIRIYRERPPTIGEVAGRIKPLSQAQVIKRLIIDLKGMEAYITDRENLRKAMMKIRKAKSQGKALEDIDSLRKELLREYKRFAGRLELEKANVITIPQLINLLNDPRFPSLIIVQAHDPDNLRHFAYLLGTYTYDKRRRTGQIFPLVSFIFDEADEFIPQKPTGTYAESVEIAMTLARRGRKFGLGIGIATQRIRYLDTNIMAQPHTYFVSKLPRKSDREAIAEAFGISEDMFRQTFKFKKGDWLLVSHDATGLESIPIPIHVENAEDAILRFLEEINRDSEVDYDSIPGSG